jgi:7 transmembrane receptor (Secretin family).
MNTSQRYVIRSVRVFFQVTESKFLNIFTSFFRRWAKSTLVLVPLFGAHYVLFIWMSPSQQIDPNLEILCLFCDQLFASLQVSTACKTHGVDQYNHAKPCLKKQLAEVLIA